MGNGRDLRIFSLNLGQRAMDFNIAFTIRLHGELHGFIDNLHPRAHPHLFEQRLNVRGVHPHTARADTQANAVRRAGAMNEIFPIPHA